MLSVSIPPPGHERDEKKGLKVKLTPFFLFFFPPQTEKLLQGKTQRRRLPVEIKDLTVTCDNEGQSLVCAAHLQIHPRQRVNFTVSSSGGASSERSKVSLPLHLEIVDARLWLIYLKMQPQRAEPTPG